MLRYVITHSTVLCSRSVVLAVGNSSVLQRAQGSFRVQREQVHQLVHLQHDRGHHIPQGHKVTHTLSAHAHACVSDKNMGPGDEF